MKTVDDTVEILGSVRFANILNAIDEFIATKMTTKNVCINDVARLKTAAEAIRITLSYQR